MPTTLSTGARDAQLSGDADCHALLWERAHRGSLRVSGHHNENYVFLAEGQIASCLGVPPGTRVKLRQPIPRALRVVLRGWISESRVLDAITGVIPDVPRCLLETEEFSVHTYAAGTVLSKECPYEKPLDDNLLDQVVEVFEKLATIDTSGFLVPPADWGTWPDDGDSDGFLAKLIEFTEETVCTEYQSDFGRLFDDLGVPEDAIRRFARKADGLASRPFSLLHTDLHRDNLVVQPGRKLFVLDWELALVGDPVYELATHLCRMRYPDRGQRDDVVGRWKAAMEKVAPAAVIAFERDLKTYIRYERIQSLYPDIMRAARRLRACPDAQTVYAETQTVQSTLDRAFPLIGAAVPSRDVISKALLAWAEAD